MKIFDKLLGIKPTVDTTGEIKLPKTKEHKAKTPTASNEETISLLMTHPLLEELRAWGSFKSKVINIDDNIKKNMAEYYLNLLFSNLYKSVYTIISNHVLYLDDTVDLTNVLIETLDNVRDESLAHGVPHIFLDQFTDYLYTQTKILSSTFEDLDNFDGYDKGITRDTFRLDLGLLLTRCITSQLEDVINRMNGELKSALEGSVFDR